jgi:hypothetical protein
MLYWRQRIIDRCHCRLFPVSPARDYPSLFGSPDLNSDALLAGLLEASNLQVLRLVNPSPLDSFGTALGGWPLLREIEIVVSRGYPEGGRMSEAIFTGNSHL